MTAFLARVPIAPRGGEKKARDGKHQASGWRAEGGGGMVEGGRPVFMC